MASQTPILHFLRPMAPPRPSTIRQFLRFSTSSRCRAAAQQQYRPPRAQSSPQQDRNLLASLTASPTYPPQSLRSDPRPKKEHAIGSRRRAANPPSRRPYPTRVYPNPPNVQRMMPEPVEPLPEAESAPNLPYFVTRTKGNELPVYSDSKRGGNLKLTYVRKISGDPGALRDALRVRLGESNGLDQERIVVNERTRQVVIKGLVKQQVVRFLRERRF